MMPPELTLSPDLVNAYVDSLSRAENGTYIELWIEPWVTTEEWTENQDSGRNRILDSLSL